MLNRFILITSLFLMGSISAQSFFGRLNPYPGKVEKVLANDTLRILAVMVNFQEDKDGATFGNGKFGSIYTQDYGTNILDPLPHDKNYFEQHLTFVKNYFEKISKGKLGVEFTVLNDTFSVSKTMRNYSPTPNSVDYTPIGEFAKEVWINATQLDSTLNFSDYDVFVIFHAGVGRDISLPGSVGNERDLPSLYLSDLALKEIFNNDLTGLPINKFGKTNSLIIPETESRELETISGKFLFEITINGLIVASIASHLGLPDLFDTETGLSAIGRFGLMDGQSIFAYNGCFPPEPSAWEKIDLGWIEATEIPQENLTANLTANLSATLSDTVILKIPINSTEYYLIENRQRDVKDKGANLTYVVNGNTLTKRFNDTTGFYSYDTDSLSGVVVDVDEFDWALPGNGIVIWHIDESVINEKRISNKINVDKERRGVDVEEADGVQDIGEKYITVFGDEVIGEGTDEDFWFKGNTTKFYKNIFSKTSRPNTNTNSGANSLITIKDFSTNSSKMGFKIEFGDSIIKPLFNQKIIDFSPAASITVFGEENKSKFAILISDSLIIYDGNTNLTKYSKFSSYKIASINYQNKNYLIGLFDDINSSERFKINYLAEDNGVYNLATLPISIPFSTNPIIRKNNTEQLELVFGTENGKVFVLDLPSIFNASLIFKDSLVFGNVGKVSVLSSDGINISGLYNSADPTFQHDYFFFNSDNWEIDGLSYSNIKATKDKTGNYITFVWDWLEKYLIFSNDKLVDTFVPENVEYHSTFVLGDLKNDGNNYLAIYNQNKLEAVNQNFSSAENFPFKLNDTAIFIGQPLTADIEGDSKSEVIAFTNTGEIFAFDGGSGKIVDGFPISFGEENIADAVLFGLDSKLSLCILTRNGYLKAWEISSIKSELGWIEKFGDNKNSNFLKAALNSNTINEFFPTAKAYNYPNPVYDGQTAIRYYVNEDSKINIKIFDIAGDFVAELKTEAQGGFDNETIWNVDNIQSGVYLANIEATGVSGKTENVVIKIAVVK